MADLLGPAKQRGLAMQKQLIAEHCVEADITKDTFVLYYSATGKLYRPKWLYTTPALYTILANLPYVNNWTKLTFLISPTEELDDMSPYIALRRGYVKEVLQLAKSMY